MITRFLKAVLWLLTLMLGGCDKAPPVDSEIPSINKEIISDFELNEATIDDLQQKMAEGIYSAEEITQLYLDRIRRIDKSGIRLNSVIELNPDALKISKQLDRERQAGKLRGPLHGIPVLIKDNIDTKDKMMTTAGSIALEGHYAEKDAFLVSKLRQAGAVILGKTNLSEWANFRSTRSTSGWSSRGGQTKNPYALNRNPCGSSSGSGVATTANLCVVAIGTETNGSIACPASINCVVGIKPTVGLVSRTGLIPISFTQDTPGPMARTVKDAAVVLSVIAGIDSSEVQSIKSDSVPQTDYIQYLDTHGLKGKRIGVEKSFLQGHEGIDTLLAKALRLMEASGAQIIEVDLLSKLNNDEAEFELLKFEFKEGLNSYLAKAKGKVSSLSELISFNQSNESRVMPYFKQEILIQTEGMESLESEAYQKVLTEVLKSRDVIDSILAVHDLDAICGPTNGPAWCTDLVNGDHFIGYGMYSPPAMAGYPSITVPMGFVQHLPVGLTFFAGAYQEPVLLKITYSFEQASKHRRLPQFLSNF